MEEKIRGTLSQRDATSQIDAYENKHAGWIYADANRKQLSDVGRLFATEANMLMQAGMSPQDAIERAQNWVQAQTGASPWDAEPKKPDTPKERVAKFRNRIPQTNGKSPLPTPPVQRPHAPASAQTNQRMTFDQKASSVFRSLMEEAVAERAT